MSTFYAGKNYDLVFRFHSVTNLPVADLGKFSSDPYLKIKLAVPLKKSTEHGWHTVKDTPGPDPDDPVLVFRTPTHHETLHPVFPPHTFWLVSNVPESGFQLTIICRDEDPSNNDDGMGKTRIEIEGITGPGWKKEHMKVELRRRNGGGSWRAFALSPVINAINGQKINSGRPVVDMSIEVLGETQDNRGRQFPYTSGPAYFSKHFSPFAGRMAGIYEKDAKESYGSPGNEATNNNEFDWNPFGSKRYNFQANVLQLQGPVPPSLNHPFVPSKWFIKKLFKGKILPHALHAHHRNIFSHDLKTVYGVIIQNDTEAAVLNRGMEMSEFTLSEIKKHHSELEEGSSHPHRAEEYLSKFQKFRKGSSSIPTEFDPEFKAMEQDNPRRTDEQPQGNAGLDKTERFLEMCGELLESGRPRKQPSVRDDGEEEEQTGGPLFTYVVTTDGQMRWSEVGAGWASEVGSKHVILANGAKHVAFAGEFFIRRKPRRQYDRRPSFSMRMSSSGGSLFQPRTRNSRNRNSSDEVRDGDGVGYRSNRESMLGDTLPTQNQADSQSYFWSQQGARHLNPHDRSGSISSLDRDLELMFPATPQSTFPRRGSDISLNTDPEKVKFQLYIDNDSGTYRPHQENIPAFRAFLKEQFPGMDVIVSHCAGEEGKKIEKMKQIHVRRGRERGEVAGDPGDAVEGGDLVFSDSSSSSSSSDDDEERSQYAERNGIGRGGKLPSGVQEFADKYGIRMMD